VSAVPSPVVVLASFILDMVVRAPRRPRAGESVFGTDFGMFAGGKGCNQAIAAARSGASVRVIGRIGDDIFSPPILDALTREHLDARFVTRDPGAGTGIAFPVVEPDGQNSIIVLPRANFAITPDDIRGAAAAFDGASVLLAQFEVPVVAVSAAVALAHERGVRVLLNPAPVPDPAPTLPPEMLSAVDVLLPNEREAESLSGIAVNDVTSAEHAARVLLARGVHSVVVTLGSRGALWVPNAEAEAVYLAPFDVPQVDATAAGDAFCGVLAAALAAGLQRSDAFRRASAAGALAVTRMGAEPSLPHAHEIDTLLRSQPRL
jgi:ribokinase